MSYLRIQGVMVPVADDAELADLQVGYATEAHDGTPRRYTRGGKRRLSCDTGPLATAEARAIAALVEGDGDGWLYEDHTWSCLGVPLDGGSASVMAVAPGMPHGHGMQVAASASWDVERPDAWTISYWRSSNGTEAAQHVLGTSAGDWWVDGSPVADPGHLTLAAGSLVLGQGVWAYVRLLPAVVPDDWVPELAAEDLVRRPPVVPRVWADAMDWPGPVVAMGTVEGIQHEGGHVLLSLRLEEW